MKLFTNQYSQARLWKNTLQVREDKKQALQEIVVPQEMVWENKRHVVQNSQVVFTNADLGHNLEERGKIQQLYKDLGIMIAVKPTFTSLRT